MATIETSRAHTGYLYLVCIYQPMKPAEIYYVRTYNDAELLIRNILG